VEVVYPSRSADPVDTAALLPAFNGWVELPSYLNPVIIGGVASLITVLTVSSNSFVTKQERSYLERLHLTPSEERDAGKTKTSVLIASVLVVNGVTMPILLLKFYVFPYQTATGTLTKSGTLDWATGEVVLALSWVIVFVGLGLWAVGVIQKGYKQEQ
ncbi:MAG: hypothetical protein AAF438_11125, partial [Pseudomonadota bacterium]